MGRRPASANHHQPGRHAHPGQHRHRHQQQQCPHRHAGHRHPQRRHARRSRATARSAPPRRSIGLLSPWVPAASDHQPDQGAPAAAATRPDAGGHGCPDSANGYGRHAQHQRRQQPVPAWAPPSHWSPSPRADADRRRHRPDGRHRAVVRGLLRRTPRRQRRPSFGRPTTAPMACTVFAYDRHRGADQYAGYLPAGLTLRPRPALPRPRTTSICRPTTPSRPDQQSRRSTR